jgi:hypothetical protein
MPAIGPIKRKELIACLRALANIQDAIAESLEAAKQPAGPQNPREVEIPA